VKVFSVLIVLVLTSVAPALRGQTNLDQIRKMEASGDRSSARTALAHALQSEPDNVAVLTEYAEFLDRYGDPAARPEYEKLLAAVKSSGDSSRAAAVSHRLALLDLLAGERAPASGNNPRPAAPEAWPTAPIPGPLRSFARMAAISPDALPEEIFPALARNVVTNGYEASHSNEALEQTEYLKLVHRYLSQARELDKLSGDDKIIKIASCDAPNVADLIRILGFRMRGGCGSEVVLETVNASRAFLTTDSGFPVDKLEEALRTNRPFRYDFHPTQVPVLFGPEYWMAGSKDSDFLGNFIGDPANCRLYLGLSKLDRETADALRKQGAYTHLKAYAHVLDFFGAMFEIRGGKAVVPGGQRSAAAWAEIHAKMPVVIGQAMVAPCRCARTLRSSSMVVSVPSGTRRMRSYTSMGAGMTNVPVPHRLLLVESILQTLGKPLSSASFSCQVFLCLFFFIGVLTLCFQPPMGS